jgi:hypothetical protein
VGLTLNAISSVVHNLTYNTRTKHVEIQHYIITEQAKAGEVEVSFIPTIAQ